PIIRKRTVCDAGRPTPRSLYNRNKVIKRNTEFSRVHTEAHKEKKYATRPIQTACFAQKLCYARSANEIYSVKLCVHSAKLCVALDYFLDSASADTAPVGNRLTRAVGKSFSPSPIREGACCEPYVRRDTGPANILLAAF